MANRFDLDDFIRQRQAMNDKILASDHLGIKRFMNLDERAYDDGALDRRTKELLGLVASLVLRCNDCIDYHLLQAVKLGVSDSELHESFHIGLVVGGSITIPHVRHAFDALEQMRAQHSAPPGDEA
jgi:AhpD family alkylhydroperoxidase